MITSGNLQCECIKLLTERYRALLSVATKSSPSLVDQKHYPEPDQPVKLHIPFYAAGVCSLYSGSAKWTS
jgi:hypothetical protein